MGKKKSTVEEQLFIMIYKLIEKKTSEIFREPVDPVALPDYYEKIKNPIDISSIIKKLKNGLYEYAYEVKEDFRLLIANCRQYNVRMDTLRLAEKFQKSIETEWGNFQKECKREELNVSQPLTITQSTLRSFQAVEQKYSRRPQMLQNILGQLQPEKKYSVQYKILPPIPQELLQGDKQNDELPSNLHYKPLKYSSMKPQQKVDLFHFKVDCSSLNNEFEEVAKKKLAKYKKILSSKIQWIEKKIFRKCMEKKRFNKMQSVRHLVNYAENQKLASGLQLRNIQMYVKEVAYWIEEYPEILSFQMKNKFIQTCKSIKKAIFRVLRYRRLPRSTKIQVNLGQDAQQNHINIQANSIDPPGQELPEEESKRYDNEIKNFKRMLAKDQSETIKKYTKITIKWENGEWTIADFNTQSADKKKPSRVNVSNRSNENTEESIRLQKQKRRNEQKQEDELFLASFKTNNSIELINNFRDKLEFDWDEIFLNRLPKVLEFKPESLVIA